VDGVVWLCSLMVDEQLATGVEARPGHGLLTGRYACYDIYRAADGWLAVGAIEASFFTNLCRALGCEELAARQFDDDAQDEIRRTFASAFATAGRDEWVDRLADAETCVAPVRSIAEVADDPETPVLDAVHPVEGRLRQLGPLLAGTAPVPSPVRLPGPGDSDAAGLLQAAGVDAATVERWLARGVVA
jgi:alpha-methylacyl-CoA racemase